MNPLHREEIDILNSPRVEHWGRLAGSLPVGRQLVSLSSQWWQLSSWRLPVVGGCCHCPYWTWREGYRHRVGAAICGASGTLQIQCIVVKYSMAAMLQWVWLVGTNKFTFYSNPDWLKQQIVAALEVECIVVNYSMTVMLQWVWLVGTTTISSYLWGIGHPGNTVHCGEL